MLFKFYKDFKQRYNLGATYLNDPNHVNTKVKSRFEIRKSPNRTEIINFLINTFKKDDTKYLEIGVRNPDDNFNLIKAKLKFGVDPGIEFHKNPVESKMTSATFFNDLGRGKILDSEVKCDVIIIDGLHLAEQVERDIVNALDFINEKGFIVIHDCNPPSEFHARETYSYNLSPAEGFWNGTTWKTFCKFRKRKDIFSCCINSDWGVGIISKEINLGPPSITENKYFEFIVFNKNREECLNLIQFNDFKRIISEKCWQL